MEGCAPLTEADKNSVMGCATRYAVEDNSVWAPRDIFDVDRNDQYQIDVAVVYVKFDINHEKRNTFVNDVAQIREAIQKTILAQGDFFE